MKAEEFCYWLQGFFELSNSNTLSVTQTQVIKDHLNLVFHKLTPERVILLENSFEIDRTKVALSC